MNIIIDYKAGNLKSVERAVNKLGYLCRITHDVEEIRRAERIIFPGVGAAGKAMNDLKRLGLDTAIKEAYHKGKPLLGICIGAQIILEKSEENDTDCLGLLKGKVKRFSRDLLSDHDESLKIPHMGWNGVHLKRNHPVLDGIRSTDEFYFVHSYYPVPFSHECVYATTDYGKTFVSILGRKSLIAVQFHLEKSGMPGLRILRNFFSWKGGYAE